MSALWASIWKMLAVIAELLEQLRAASQAEVIRQLNPIIGGWAAYYDGFVSAHSLSRYDELVRHLLLNWGSKRHPNKESQWITNCYWHPVEEGEWMELLRQSDKSCCQNKRIFQDGTMHL